MKKLFVGAMVALALLGAGCFKGQTTDASVNTSSDGTMKKPESALQGVWYLSFTLPDGWVFVPHYDKTSTTVMPADVPLDTDMVDAVLQSTNKIIIPSGTSTLPAEKIVTSDFTYIRVLRMAKSVIVSKDAKDLGDGFFKTNDGAEDVYYWKAKYGTYKFMVSQNGQDPSVAEDVIFSAKEVTDFSAGTPKLSVDVKTETKTE